jgi:hypothetical protein
MDRALPGTRGRAILNFRDKIVLSRSIKCNQKNVSGPGHYIGKLGGGVTDIGKLRGAVTAVM